MGFKYRGFKYKNSNSIRMEFWIFEFKIEIQNGVWLFKFKYEISNITIQKGVDYRN